MKVADMEVWVEVGGGQGRGGGGWVYQAVHRICS